MKISKIIHFFIYCMLLSACTPAAAEVPLFAPTPSITPQGTPEVTPDPDQPAVAAMAQIEALTASNGGCQYPCFWGITPGVTTLAEARSIIEPLTFTSAPNLDEQGSGVWDVYFYDTVGGLAAGFEDLRLVFVEGVVSEIRYDPGTAAVWDVLGEFGQPEEVVYAFSTQNYPMFSPYCDLILLYPTRGMAVHLLIASGFEVPSEGEPLRFELPEATMISQVSEYVFYAPADAGSSQAGYVEALLSGTTSYINIREGMGLTPEEFVEMFGDYQLDDVLVFTLIE